MSSRVEIPDGSNEPVFVPWSILYLPIVYGISLVRPEYSMTCIRWVKTLGATVKLHLCIYYKDVACRNCGIFMAMPVNSQCRFPFLFCCCICTPLIDCQWWFWVSWNLCNPQDWMWLDNWWNISYKKKLHGHKAINISVMSSLFGLTGRGMALCAWLQSEV